MQLNQSSGEWRLVGNVEVESAAMGNNHPTRDTPRSRRTIDDVLNGHDSPRAPPSKPPREPSIRRQPPPPPPRGESALMREAEDADRRDGFSDDEGSAVAEEEKELDYATFEQETEEFEEWEEREMGRMHYEEHEDSTAPFGDG